MTSPRSAAGRAGERGTERIRHAPRIHCTIHGDDEGIYPLSPEQKLAFAREQCYIALGNAVNGAKSLGIDSCPMGGFDPAGYAKILFLPEEYIPVVVCAIGYAADTPLPKWRLPREEVFV